MRRRDTITAAGFLLLLAAGFGLLVTAFFGGEGHLEGLLRTAWVERDPQALLEGAESAVNQDLDRDHWFIQLYGGVQRLTLRRVVEDAVGENSVAKLSTGALNFVDLQREPAPEEASANAAAVAALVQDLEALDIPYRFLLAPQKIQRGQAMLPTGVPDYGNENASTFLQGLEEAGVAYTDFRPLLERNGVYADWFFRTDHHWRPEAAFFVWQALAGVLEEAYGFSTDPALLDGDNWERQVLEDFFLGSQGKRVGSLYAGTDSITLYSPRFDTDFTYTCPLYGMERTGPFSESLCFPERVARRDWFGENPYVYYGGGDYPLATIVNHNNPNGPRIVLLRDSFACALTPFLALSCGELVTIDLRHFSGNLLDTIAGLEPDLVLTLYTAGTTSNSALFQFEATE